MLSEEMANEQGIEVPGIGRIQMTEDSSESVIQSVLPMVSGFQRILIINSHAWGALLAHRQLLICLTRFIDTILLEKILQIKFDGVRDKIYLYELRYKLISFIYSQGPV